jgi:hypothetical protein
LFANAEDAFRLDAAFHLLGKFLKFNELGIDEVRGLLLEKEPRLSFWSATAPVDLDAFKRFNEFLLVGLVELDGVAASNALKHSRIQTRANARDLRGHGIDGDHASNVISTELRNRTDLVAWKVNDADEWHQIAFTSIKKKLTKRLVSRPEMMVGVAQNVLSKLVVISLNFSERDLERAFVWPHFCQIVNGFGVLVLEQGSPTSGEVKFLHRRH